MANLNKVILIGRIVADPDPVKDLLKFDNGGKLTKLRFVVNNSRFDKQEQKWIDEPVWLDLKFFNRGETGKLADRAAQLRKPQQICLEGHLVMEEWNDQSGQKRQKIVIHVDSFQLLDRRENAGGEGGGYDGAGMGGSRPQRTTTNTRTPATSNGGGRNFNGGGGGNNGGGGRNEEDSFDSGSGGGTDEEIPF